VANQSITRTEKVSRGRSNKAEQQIPFDVEKNIGGPQPTTREKSGAAQVSPAQNRHALAMSIAEHL